MDPVFDPEQLAQQLGALPGAGGHEPPANDASRKQDVFRVLRTITDNDIRARIIGLPADTLERFMDTAR